MARSSARPHGRSTSSTWSSGSPGGFSGPVFDPATDPEAFKNYPAMTGVTPTEDDHRGTFVILLEPVPADKLARAVAAGVVPVRVDVPDEDYPYSYPWYGAGCVDSTGWLVGLPSSFTSQYSYNGYMQLQIGCRSASGTQINWPGSCQPTSSVYSCGGGAAGGGGGGDGDIEPELPAPGPVAQ